MNQKKRKIALLVFQHVGHHTHFAKLAYEALSQVGETILIVPDSVIQSEEFQSAFCEKNITVRSSEKKELQEFMQHAISGEFSDVFSIALDSFWLKILPRLLWAKSTGQLKACISGILISAAFAYPENKHFSLKWLRCFCLKNIVHLVFSHLYLIDEIAYKKLFPKGNMVCGMLPDPIEPPSTVQPLTLRQKFGWDEKKKIMLVIGVMIPEKRLDLLLRAFIKTSPLPGWQLIFVGKFAPNVYKQLTEIRDEAACGSQIIFINRWLENVEINEMVLAADFIWCAYAQHFGNASILFRAIQANKNSLVADSGWIGRFAIQYHYGVKVNPYSEDSYKTGIQNIFSTDHFSIPEWNAEKNSEKKFIEIIRENISSKTI